MLRRKQSYKRRRFVVLVLLASLAGFAAYRAGAFEGLNLGVDKAAAAATRQEKAFGPIAERIHAGQGWAMLSPAENGQRRVAYMVESGGGAWSTLGPVHTVADATEAEMMLDGNLLVLQTARNGAPQFTAFTYGENGLQPADFYTVKAPQPSVQQGQFVLVNKRLNALWHYSDGKLVKAYRVATGRQTAGPAPSQEDYRTNFFTPEGIFQITDFKKNPPYGAMKPGDKSYAGGDPQNPFGTRWMGFSVYGWDGTSVWGIHGTAEPEKIGTWASDGCVRMRTEQAEALFNLLQGKVVTLQIVAR